MSFLEITGWCQLYCQIEVLYNSLFDIFCDIEIRKYVLSTILDLIYVLF